MDITPFVPENKQLVQSYGSGRFRVSRVDYQGSIIVLPERTLFWGIDAFDDIKLCNLSPILEEVPKIEVLLIGCGEIMKVLPRDLAEKFRQEGLFIEVMDTGAACRTYNILLAEGRRVAASLIALT